MEITITEIQMIIILAIITAFFFFWNKKITFYKDRIGKKKIIGEFEKYELVTAQVLRNESYTSVYPFVKIYENEEDYGIFRLNFKNINSKKFKKGEKIELFWSNNELLYWNTYDIGFMKYLPKKGLFNLLKEK